VTTLSNEGTVPTVPLPRLTMRDLYARAGLPVPIYPEKPTQTHDNRTWDSKIGTLTHLISGRLAPTAQAMRGQELRVLIGETVGAMVKDRSLGRLDKARLRVTGMVAQYLTHFVPPAPTVFLGTELAAGTGRVDLAWDDPTAGVFFDEIKTWRHVQATLDEDTWTQVHRYLDHGIATYGDRFAGVRVITLSHLLSCIRISPEGLVESLAMSPLHPCCRSPKFPRVARSSSPGCGLRLAGQLGVMGGSGTEMTAAPAGMTTLMIARGWRQCGQRCWLPGVGASSRAGVGTTLSETTLGTMCGTSSRTSSRCRSRQAALRQDSPQ
jgi:hypothetical protein